MYQSVCIKGPPRRKLYVAHLSVGWDLLDKHFFFPWMPGAKGRFVKEEVVNHSLSRKLAVLWKL